MDYKRTSSSRNRMMTFRSCNQITVSITIVQIQLQCKPIPVGGSDAVRAVLVVPGLCIASALGITYGDGPVDEGIVEGMELRLTDIGSFEGGLLLLVLSCAGTFSVVASFIAAGVYSKRWMAQEAT